MSETQPFLYYPANRAYLEGKTRQLQNPERAHYAHAFYLGPPTLLALLVCIGWLGFLFVGWQQQAQTSQLLLQSGQQTQATITDLRDDGGGFEPHSVEYQFVPEGQDTAVSGEQTISESEFRSLEVGESIDITYLPADPAISNYEGEGALPVWPCIPIFLVPVVGWYVLNWFRTLRPWQQMRRLERDGIVLDGEVEASRRSGEIGPRAHMVVHYLFYTPEGKEMHDKLEGMTSGDLTPPEPGTPVKLVYVDEELFRLL